MDSKYTKKQQLESGFFGSLEETGPAAGRTWKDTPPGLCEVTWGDSAGTMGKVIYIPQNSLFNLNERSSEITARIEPILFRARGDFEIAHRKASTDIENIGGEVQKSLKSWFSRSAEIRDFSEKMADVGDPEAIRKQKEALASQLAKQRADAQLLSDDIVKYQSVMEQLSTLSVDKVSKLGDLSALGPYFTSAADQSEDAISANVAVSITTSPTPAALPLAVQQPAAKLISDASASLSKAIADLLVAHHQQVTAKVAAIEVEISDLRAENSSLIERNEANTVVDELVKQLAQQDSALALIDKFELELKSLVESRDESISSLVSSLECRAQLIDNHLHYFADGLVEVDGMYFGIEGGHDAGKLSAISQDFDQRSNTDFVERNVGLKIEQVLAKPSDFLEALVAGDQKLKQGKSMTAVAEQVFTFVPDFHFFAELEGDRIGGFGRSSMTPGKQAMFALQLILNESDDRWPLLIDQPDDDLDSRSIYDHVVPYRKRRKTERQVIMVTHNANLVVGADSEQVIVANRHGSDSKNAGGRTFDYLAGSLEHTLTYRERPHKLESCGIREHACEILDGGTEAFQKRKDKYRV
ncbi:hypothetical protein ASPU41_17500 [Arthrobacter sp. U41]|nr:hypothetical protein ASPU41_17500 [Arthrobacter sp. U41]